MLYGFPVLVHPNNVRVTYTSDSDGQTATHRDPNTVLTTFQYDAMGAQTTITYQSGRVHVSTFNAEGRNTVRKDNNGTVLQATAPECTGKN